MCPSPHTSTESCWREKPKAIEFADMPQPAEAWKRALAALDDVARQEQGRPFAQLTQGDQDAMLRRMSDGSFHAKVLNGMPAKTFWTSHVVHDVVGAYYAHPEAWNEIGWGGPASPRGYVRTGLDRRELLGAGGSHPRQRRQSEPGEQACQMILLQRRAQSSVGRPMCSGPAAGSRCGSSPTRTRSTSS